MRRWILAFMLSLATGGLSQQFRTKAFVDQDFHVKEWKTVERFGKTESDIVRMGHDPFVKWYCDDSRAGTDGRIQAEKVFNLALTECNAPLLQRLSRQEQKFMEDLISGLGDMAKSCFVVGVLSTNESPGWNLPIAESSTAVSETIHAILNPLGPVREEPRIDFEPLFAQVSERLKAKRPNAQNEGDRLRFLTQHLQKIVKDRSDRDKVIVRSFTVRMLKVALLSPS